MWRTVHSIALPSLTMSDEEYLSLSKSLPESGLVTSDHDVVSVSSESATTATTSLSSSPDGTEGLRSQEGNVVIDREEGKERRRLSEIHESVDMAPKLFTRKNFVEGAASPPGRGHSREYLFKILVIGELATGKTSFIKRYVHQFFSDHYRATIGVDFALKVVNWDENTLIRLQLWDIAGQERFGNMTRVYYKEAVGAFIVFDVSRPSTFEAVTKWKNDLDAKVSLPDGSPVPVVLLANKSDGKKEGSAANAKALDSFCAECGFSGWYYTSAKENQNVEDAARFLISKILQSRKAFEGEEEDMSDNQIVTLTHGGKGLQPEKTCSC